MLCKKADQVIEQRLALSLCQLVFLGQTGREMLENDWRLVFAETAVFA